MFLDGKTSLCEGLGRFNSYLFVYDDEAPSNGSGIRK